MKHAGSTIELQRNGGSESPSLSDQIYDYLSEQIIHGHIRYGDRLNIRSIAARLNVSPMPIRDALKRLEMEKLVIIRPRSTCYVRVPTKKMTIDAVETRRMLEVFAVSQAYASVEPADLAELRTILAEMHRLVHLPAGKRTRAVIEAYIELDHQFHTALCALAKNEYVNRFYRETNAHLNMSFRYGMGLCHGLEATYHDHELIFRHLEARSDEAVTVLEAHLRQSRQNILNEPTFQMLED